jgi:phosphoglycolate phosphatase
MLEPRFGLVILDLDGTLVDSEAMLVGLVNETLTANGHPPAAPRSVAATIGLPLEEVFRRALRGCGDATIAALCTHYRARADAMEFVSRFRLFDGVASTLEALRAAGARLVVGTSKGRETTLDIVRHCGIADAIDEVIGGDCVARGKPHPEMVERALLTFGVDPTRALVVGDTTFDLEMGQAAGVATCGVTYGMHEPSRLRALQPTFLIDRFDALTAVVTRSS